MPIESNLYEDKTKEIVKKRENFEKNRANSSKNLANNKVFSLKKHEKNLFFPR